MSSSIQYLRPGLKRALKLGESQSCIRAFGHEQIDGEACGSVLIFQSYELLSNRHTRRGEARDPCDYSQRLDHDYLQPSRIDEGARGCGVSSLCQQLWAVWFNYQMKDVFCCVRLRDLCEKVGMPTYQVVRHS